MRFFVFALLASFCFGNVALAHTPKAICITCEIDQHGGPKPIDPALIDGLARAIGPNSPIEPPARSVNGCVPLDSAIGFAGEDVYIDNVKILGGEIADAGQTYGKIHLSSEASGGALSGQSVDGSISMNVVPKSAPRSKSLYYTPPEPTRASLSGVIRLNAAAIQYIQAYQEAMGEAKTPVCVKNVAVWAIHNGSQLQSVIAYLYLNNSEHGIRVKLSNIP